MHKNKSSIRIQRSGGSSEETKGKKRKKGKLILKGAFMSKLNKSQFKQHATFKFMPNVGEYLSNCIASHSRRHLPL
jgi:translation initiation factor 2 beta subunit (eIF-2beta)/eIF-5